MQQDHHEHVRLTWQGAEHWLTFEVLEDTIHGTFVLKKSAGKQTIHFVIPQGLEVTIESIKEAWELQKQSWRELFVYKDGPFVAVRAIVLADDLCVLWHVFHMNDAPFDAVCVMKLPGAAEMGTIIAYKAD
jgi:hypothetical protein